MPRHAEIGDDFVRRQRCLAGRILDHIGRWSVRWAKDVTAWYSHCVRAHGPAKLHAALLGVRAEDFLQLHHNEHSLGGLNNRTGIRVAGIGRVTQRYDSGILLARECCTYSDIQLTPNSLYKICAQAQIFCSAGSYDNQPSVMSTDTLLSTPLHE